MTEPKKHTVTVARYEHRHGVDVRVFATAEGAEQWRREIAAEWWDNEIDPKVKKPDDPETLANTYWEKMADGCREEFFESEECEVQP